LPHSAVQRISGVVHASGIFGIFAASVGESTAAAMTPAKMIFVIDFASMETPRFIPAQMFHKQRIRTRSARVLHPLALLKRDRMP
jgi:hypothetical protein